MRVKAEKQERFIGSFDAYLNCFDLSIAEHLLLLLGLAQGIQIRPQYSDLADYEAHMHAFFFYSVTRGTALSGTSKQAQNYVKKCARSFTTATALPRR